MDSEGGAGAGEVGGGGMVLLACGVEEFLVREGILNRLGA